MKCASCEAEMTTGECPFGCVQSVEECEQVIARQLREMERLVDAHRSSLHDLNMICQALSEMEIDLAASLGDIDTGTDAAGNDL